MITAEIYTPSDKKLWNDMVTTSRNGTFLFDRDYMDYHSDRFIDSSLIFYEKGRPLCLFAASRHEDMIIAHGGLTYGGIILPYNHLNSDKMLTVFRVLLETLKSRGARRLIYKAVPHIYHKYPSEEDLYAIFRNGGKLYETDISTTVLLSARRPFNENSRRNMAKAMKLNVAIEFSEDFNAYWDMLEALMSERFNTTPVHTLGEMTRLHRLFPDNIKLIMAKNRHGEPIAGTVIYITDTTVHCQYIATTSEGRASGALPLLFETAITHYTGQKSFFDFGTSNENHGRILNAGLIQQKTGMGGRGVAYNTFLIDI